MNRFYVIPKYDLHVWPHTWVKGREYECIDKEKWITLASEQGQVNYKKPLIDENGKDWFDNLFVKVMS